MDQVFDVAIIGGGINGCGCAADAAQRGLSVVLLEQDDLASKTSSSSTKLIHGGLRYLENYEFSLVKKAIKERQRLLDLAPHLVHPQALVLPYQKQMRPAWILRSGLFLYDHLSRHNGLPHSQSIKSSKQKQYFAPLAEQFQRGYLFYDGATDDARLTIVNALQAKKFGASIRNYTTVKQCKVVDGLWQITVQPQTGTSYTIRARTLINAAGPWVKAIEKLTDTPDKTAISLVKGSHIIVPSLYEGTHAYLLQHQDKRIIFVIPYHGFSMIGTTDVPLTEDSLDQIKISNEEIDYLINLVNSYFQCKITKKEIVDSWSGVRALLANDKKEARSLSRDYHYEYQVKPAPVVTIYGGKITTYRQLAEEVINQLQPIFPNLPKSQTHLSPLPGAIYRRKDFQSYKEYALDKYHWLEPKLLQRYFDTYGTCMESFLAPCNDYQDLGQKYGESLYQVEVNYLIKEEWARNAEDILKRRTKLGLMMDSLSKNELQQFISQLHQQVEPLLP